MWHGFMKFASALFGFMALAGCASVSYVAQSADGHIQLLAARQSVEKLARDPKQPPQLRRQMRLAQEIRQFAIDELHLPDNRSYKSYVDVGRDYVTVAIFAAPEFSFQPKLWCFPVFGCVPYRAHFGLERAIRERDELAGQGFDTHVTGVTAYSTLGWTADPLLNTMFRDNQTHLPGVVFHELAHQKVYIANDSAFNEAFAVAVERTGVERWLKHKGEAQALKKYAAEDRRTKQFLALVDDTRQQLAKIYESHAGVEQKRARKQAEIERLRKDFKRLRDGQWAGYSGFDGWFDGEINNAKILATGVYSDLVPDFIKLFEACGEDYPRFYEAVRRLGKVRQDQRLSALKEASCI